MRIHQNGPLDKLMQFMRSSISRIVTYGAIKEFMRPVLDSHKINKTQSKNVALWYLEGQSSLL